MTTQPPTLPDPMPEPVAGMVTADDVCVALEAILEEHLWPLAEQLGKATGPLALKKPTTWQQLPTRDALVSATFPAGAIDSPGLADTPTRSGSGRVSATWRVGAAIYDRGSSHKDTARRARVWAGLIRTCVLQHPSLGGVARSTSWAGEEYAEIPARSAARTLGGCAVAFDVTVPDAFDLDALPPSHLVTSTHPTVSARRPAGSQ